MVNTILFDLDGTLLPIDQERFVKAYFGEVVRRFSPHGYTKEQLVDSIWAGTGAMLKNDGSRSNYEAFWDHFSGLLGKEVLQLEPAFYDFYDREFHAVKALVPEGYSVRSLLDALKEQGFTLVLATNPMFPQVASASRLQWIGASLDDFAHVTTMENSRYSKPNPNYYKELLHTIGKTPEECLMVGNNAREDMCAAGLGCRVFLATDYLENEHGEDISGYPSGSLAELLPFVESLKAL